MYIQIDVSTDRAYNKNSSVNGQIWVACGRQTKVASGIW